MMQEWKMFYFNLCLQPWYFFHSNISLVKHCTCHYQNARLGQVVSKTGKLILILILRKQKKGYYRVIHKQHNNAGPQPKRARLSVTSINTYNIRILFGCVLVSTLESQENDFIKQANQLHLIRHLFLRNNYNLLLTPQLNPFPL